MRFHTITIAAAMAVLLPNVPLPAYAHDGVAVIEPYARTSGGAGSTGAVFMVLDNHVDREDRLVAVTTDVAEKAELHTHVMSAEGLMQMLPVEDGFVVPPLGQHALARGGDHIMLIGLTRDLKDGDVITLTLDFAASADVVVEVPVDNARTDGGGGHDHDMMEHGDEHGADHGAAHGAEHGAAHGDHAAMDGHGAGHAGHGAALVDTTGMADPEAIVAIMKAQFDTPENPLTVEPVVVQGDHALAAWAQGDRGGRALLERREGQWVIVLCGGEDLRLPTFLAAQGVTAAEALSQLYNATEDGLGADKVALYSSFEGVLMVAGPAE
jgi:periplasmic copper chaperone A